MASGTYDIITVGGGLGGAALAKTMAEHGARVLVLEREKQFKDRVRGEGLVPWGVVETQALGLYELFRTTCAHELPQFGFSAGLGSGEPRDLIATTPQRLPCFSFYHPAMQEVLLHAATDGRRRGPARGKRAGCQAGEHTDGCGGTGGTDRRNPSAAGRGSRRTGFSGPQVGGLSRPPKSRWADPLRRAV